MEGSNEEKREQIPSLSVETFFFFFFFVVVVDTNALDLTIQCSLGWNSPQSA